MLHQASVVRDLDYEYLARRCSVSRQKKMRKCALSTVQGACSIHCFDLAQLSSKKHIWKKSGPEAEFRMESIERIIKSKKKKISSP